MALRLLAAAALSVAVIFSTPVDAQQVWSSDGVRAGDTRIVHGYCKSPLLHKRLLALVRDGRVAEAKDERGQARTLGHCKRITVEAKFTMLMAAMRWPGEPEYEWQQWEIELPDGGTRYVLIVVRGVDG